MANITKFRTSMGGFNRADVANYMESMAAEHHRVKKQMQEENDFLSARLAELEQQTVAQSAQLQELQQKLTDTEAALSSAETALSSTESALEEALTMIEERDAIQAAQEAAAELAAQEAAAELAAQEAAAEEAEPAPDYTAMELEAYRRAEAMERTAQERSVRIRRKVSNYLDNLSARYEQTGQEMEALSEDIRTNLKRLQEALSDLDLIFEEASGRFDTLDTDEVSLEDK